MDASIVLEERNEHIFDREVIVYAGGVFEKYGVKQLVEAFIAADLANTELHIYGDGSFVDELNQICQKHSNVLYKGCVLNTVLPFIECEASLLVNPRFSNEEYTKFSFPSKTLEYMSSGTPVLSTKLPGIPDDYQDYLYWFEDESLDGMTKTLRAVMSIDSVSRKAFGEKARQYAKTNKNSISQGKRIASFSEEIVNKGDSCTII